MKLLGNHKLKLTALSIFLLSCSQPLLAYAGEANQLRQGFSKNLIEFIFNRGTEENDDNDDNDGDNSSDSERPRRRPTGRTPAADRDDCPATALPFTALVPTNDPAWTVSEYPTFWFYIPHEPDEIVAGEFVYTNQDGERIYRGFFELQNTPGIVQISIPPESTVGLSVDHNYRWFLKLLCDPRDPSSYVFLEGDIKRVDVNETLMSELNSDSIEDEDYIIYGRHGIWHDALTSLGSRLRADGTEEVIQDNWRKILEDQDLGHLADEPVLECCTPEQL